MATVLPKLVGDRIKRREDPALIQGLGRYVDDVLTVGTLHAAFFRSPYAHARIRSLNVEAAKNHPGVVTVLTGADLLGKVGTIPCGAAGPGMKLGMRLVSHQARGSTEKPYPNSFIAAG